MEENQYLNILRKLLKASESGDRTGTGTLKLFGEQMTFSLENNCLPLLTSKRVPFRLIAEELLWFLSGATDVGLLQKKNVHIWDENSSKEECAKFAREEGDLGPIYGHQWRNFSATLREKPLEEDGYSEKNKRWVNRAYNDDGVDQIKNIIETIQKNPNSRRILLTGWNPLEADLVNPPPCHTFYQFQVDNGKLNASLYQRSGDFFLGVAFNLSSLSLFCHLLAHVCNLKPGKVFHAIGDCHLYLNHVEQAKTQIERELYPFPKLLINDSLRGGGFDALLSATTSDFTIEGYKSHGTIKAKMSV